MSSYNKNKDNYQIDQNKIQIWLQSRRRRRRIAVKFASSIFCCIVSFQLFLLVIKKFKSQIGSKQSRYLKKKNEMRCLLYFKVYLVSRLSLTSHLNKKLMKFKSAYMYILLLWFFKQAIKKSHVFLLLFHFAIKVFWVIVYILYSQAF